MTNSKITQSFYVVNEYERDDALIRLYTLKTQKNQLFFVEQKKKLIDYQLS